MWKSVCVGKDKVNVSFAVDLDQLQSLTIFEPVADKNTLLTIKFINDRELTFSGEQGARQIYLELIKALGAK